jgi:hypothetical protein
MSKSKTRSASVTRIHIEPVRVEHVHDPMVVNEVLLGLARNVGGTQTPFIGMTLKGLDDRHIDTVMTVELAEYLIKMLERAVVKAKAQTVEHGHA